MPRVLCECGTSYELKDEFAGKLVKCPQCGRENRVPGTASAAKAQADPVFDRDIFLLRQQLLKISEKYDVGDEQGNKLIFVERPAHLLQNLGAILASLTVMVVVVAGGAAALDALLPNVTDDLAGVLVLLLMVVALVGGLAVGIVLSAKRHVTFYRDASKGDPLLEVLQDAKFQPITQTFTIRDAQHRPLARLRKNVFTNMLRKKWWVLSPSGTAMAIAKEDSVILSLLRRLLGPFFGLLRTNFVIQRADSEEDLGEFKRKFTILDRYVLDLTADRMRSFDRRVALALGVMLDTAERR